MRWSAAWLLTMGVSACAWQGPALAGHPGLQYQVISFYGALPRSGNCRAPTRQMRSVTSTRVVEDNSAKVVMDLRYYLGRRSRRTISQAAASPSAATLASAPSPSPEIPTAPCNQKHDRPAEASP